MTFTQCPECGRVYNISLLKRCPRCGGKLEEIHPWLAEGGGERPAERKVDGCGEGEKERESKATPWEPSQAVEDVVLEYRNKLNEEPDNHTVRYSLAYAYMLAEEFERAAEHLEQVIEAMPEFGEAYYRLAICRARMGDIERAVELAERAVDLEPDNMRYEQLVERLRGGGEEA